MRHHACDHEPIEVIRHNAAVSAALDAAVLAIDEYYNGDRAWAEQWLIKAMEANTVELAPKRSLAHADWSVTRPRKPPMP
jgi:hypothetical protein